MIDLTTEPRPALITPEVDPALVLDSPACHPWMLVSALAVYANGDAVFRCPACHHQWRLGYSPDYLRGTRR